MFWLRAEDVDWVHLVSDNNNGDDDEESEHSVTLGLPAAPVIEQQIETKKFALQSFDSEYIKTTVHNTALLQSGDLESIAQQMHWFVSNDQPTLTISRELLEIGKHLLDANPRIGLHCFIAPLVWNTQPVSQFPCEALAERLVLQNPILLADDKVLNAFATHLLRRNNNNDFSDLEMGFWQRCILTRQLSAAVLEEFLTKLDTSSHTRLVASVVFALIKSNKSALQAHTATLRCVLNRCLPNAPMLAPAKRAFQQIDK